jgi:peptide/nickel transport system substrate-binding protein
MKEEGMHRLKRRYGPLALSTAVAAAAALVVVAAGPAVNGRAAAGSVHSAKCKSYGTLSYGLAGQGITSLDPNTIAFAGQWPLNSLVYEGLTTYDQNGNAVPDLATRWRHSSDDKTWWFFLRHDAHYADGRGFRAADAVANILRVLNPAVPSQARGNIKDFQSVRALNKFEIRIRLGSPSSIVPDQLFLVRMSDLTNPTALNTTGYGTGPYMVQNFVPNQSLTLVPNPHYTGPKTQCFTRIAFLREPDPTSMVTDFTSKKLGVIWNVPISAVPQINSDKDAYLVKPSNISSLDAWEVDTTSPPFNNPLARQALSYAIDRDAMVKVALQGQGTPSTSNDLINTTSPAFDKGLKPYTFDLDKAKQLFTQAGVAPGTALTYWAESGTRPEWVTMGEILQQDLSKIGIKLNIVQSDPSTWLAKFFPNPKSFPGLIVANFLSLQPNPVLAMSFASSHKCECNWNNAAFDAVYFKALGASDDATLTQYVDQMQTMFSTASPVLAIAHATNIVAVQKGIAGVWEDPRGNVHLENAYFTNASGQAKQ